MAKEPITGDELRQQLDDELTAASKRLGVRLHFTWHEQQAIDEACRLADQLVALRRRFDEALAVEGALSQAATIRCSAEIRSLERALSLCLARISFRPEKQEKQKSARHQRAAMQRWNREAGAADA